MSRHWVDRLSAYVDGELDAGEAARLEAHVAECASCAAALTDVTEIVAAAKRLPAEPPAPDLWPAISERLTPRDAGGTRHAVFDLEDARRARRVALSVPQLVAAGIALMLVSASAMWLAMGGTAAPVATVAAPGSASSASFVSTWDAAVVDLEAAFARQRASLDPGTILVVERNLAIIDAAIAEARQALEADPSSGFLRGYVADAMRRKVDLLRQATRIQRTES